jgi:flagellar biogenesis protein FliO
MNKSKLKDYIFIFAIIILLAYIFLLKNNFKHEEQQPKVITSSRQVEQLRDSIKILKVSNKELLLSFLQRERDHQDETIINYETNITKVTPSIGTYSDRDRDKLWSDYTSKEDSVPRGHWDILNQKTGGRSIKEISVEGFLQK